MATLLLIIIYISFIGLGLPDALLGAGWPVIQSELNVPFEFAGLIQMLISGGTIVSSVFAGYVLRRFGTGKVTAFSVASTALALFGFAFSPSFPWFLAVAIPLGLGAGAVDAGLNAYVASHYESRHMSWLHSFWGVGALSGPLVLSSMLSRGISWRSGYLGIAMFQTVLFGILLMAFPLWTVIHRRKGLGTEDAHTIHSSPVLYSTFKTKGVPFALLTFLAYCGIESTMGLWGGSYLFRSKGLDAIAAASWVSLFYTSITIGRFLTGFMTYHISNNNLIRSGALIILCGAVLMLVPLPLTFTLAGFLMIGFGCAPIFPCMLHATPERFGSILAKDIIGLQMAAAYVGSSLLPPIFGFFAGAVSFKLFPIFLFLYITILVFGSEKLRNVKSTVSY